MYGVSEQEVDSHM